MSDLVLLWFLVSKYLLQKYNRAVVLVMQGGRKNIQGFPPFLLGVMSLSRLCPIGAVHENAFVSEAEDFKNTQSSAHIICCHWFSYLIKVYFFHMVLSLTELWY